MRDVTMHIFPTHGSWQVTDLVEVMFSAPDAPLERRYNEYNTPHRVPRDWVFTMLSHPSIRNRYVDIVHHAEPYAV
jgi:hypothetical protein